MSYLTHYLTVAPLYSFSSYRMVTPKCSFIVNGMITPSCAMRTTMLFIYMMALKQGHFLSFSKNFLAKFEGYPAIIGIINMKLKADSTYCLLLIERKLKDLKG